MTKKAQAKRGEVVIYRPTKGEARVEVRLEKNSVANAGTNRVAFWYPRAGHNQAFKKYI